MHKIFSLLFCLTLFLGCASDPATLGGLGEACNEDGSCDGDLECREGTCLEPEVGPCDSVDCSGHGDCQLSNGEPSCVCNTGYAGETCSACDEVHGYMENPPDSGLCVEDPCFAVTCTDGALRCVDDSSYQTCQDNCWGEAENCEADQVCLDDLCQTLLCTPNEITGCTDTSNLERCNETGTAMMAEPCPEGEFCNAGVCAVPSCVASETRCADIHTPEICAEDGSGYESLEPCYEKDECVDGTCVSLCDLAESLPGSLGCEFVALDLDQHEEVDAGQLSLLLSNPHPDITASLSIVNGAGTVLVFDPYHVPAGDSLVVNLPRQDLEGSGLTNKSYRLISDMPISAAQFNPLSPGYFSADASRLIPTRRLGNEYLVLGWPSLYREYPETDHPPSVSIVATSDQETTITVTSPVAIRPGTGVPAMAANTPTQFTLQAWQVLSLATIRQDALDLSGMHIQANEPIAVFFGHEVAQVPMGTDFSDHLEEQLLPLSAWGSSFLCPAIPPRGTEPTLWRLLASEDGTNLVTNPVISISGSTLNRGEVLEFITDMDFVLTANQPVLIAQFSVGASYEGVPAICAGSSGTGDPSMLILPALDHHGTQWAFEVPEGYDESRLTLVSASSAPSILLDGVLIPAEDWMLFVGADDHGVARFEIAPGHHVLQSDEPFSVLMHIWSCQLFYGLAAGYVLDPN
ncbi:MAG: hypothetical protein JRF33_26040 [Deltaproteobacteria bacterium]|nr:hypothetical protein [Deltaproteobacteria bacterium]